MKTATKIGLASALSRCVRFARRLALRPDEGVFRRRGLNWRLDLKQGIDFAIYLFGRFEPATFAAYARRIKAGDTVVDIGANIGAHTLQFANLVGATGKVAAFEPTAYAFGKLKRNVELNPSLADRIVACQCMLTADDAGSAPEAIYSSWPLTGKSDLHAVHRGELQSTAGAQAQSLDTALSRAGIGRVDWIKLDVDGNEPEVIAGAKRTLEQFRPTIFMEVAPYLFDGQQQRFETMLTYLGSLGYQLEDEKTASAVPHQPAELRAFIGNGQSLNVIAAAQR